MEFPEGLNHALLEGAGHSIYITDTDGTILYVNPAFEEITGYSKEEVVGETPRILKSGKHSEEFYEEIWNTILSGDVWKGELLNRRKGGELYYVEQTISPIKNSNGESEGFVAINVDVTERKQAQQKAEFLAAHDPVTELPSRRTFLNELRDTLSTNPDQLAVGLGRVKQLRRIDELLGYEDTDEVLNSLTDQFQEAVPDVFSLYMFERHTMAGVLTGSDAVHRMEEYWEEWIQLLDDFPRVQGLPFLLNGNVGISIYPAQSKTVKGLVGLARRALNEAEDSPDRHVEVYSTKFMGTGYQDLQLEREFEQALEQGGLELHYQPRIDLEDESVVGAEALIRWNHPEEGWVSPGQILYFASISNNEYALDRFVLRRVLEQIQTWSPQEKMEGLVVSINLTYATFLQANEFLQLCRDEFQQADVAPQQVEFEVTEQQTVEDVEYTIYLLEEIQGMGFNVALDDFGTGNSCLLYLNQFPLDVLKVDRSFISKVDQNTSNQVMVRTILNLADEMDLETVAEGPERQEEIKFSQDHGADYAQGYYYSQPLPPEEFMDYLNEA